MLAIHICIGSACHLKGSYTVIDQLQKSIKKDKLETKVEIKATFCLGHCTSAVSIKIDDGEIMSVSPESVDTFYEKHILRRVQQ